MPPAPPPAPPHRHAARAPSSPPARRSSPRPTRAPACARSSTLLALKLPLLNKTDDPARGLAFEFLADPDDPAAPRVLTGHAAGVITVNVAEADDAERERQRHQFHEPYRTLLGHFRHESG